MLHSWRLSAMQMENKKKTKEMAEDKCNSDDQFYFAFNNRNAN